MPFGPGKIIYRVVKYTSPDAPVSLFANLPVYKQYLLEGTSETLVSNAMFWKPGEAITTKPTTNQTAAVYGLTGKVCSGFIEYTNDLENSFTTKDIARCAQNQEESSKRLERKEKVVFAKSGEVFVYNAVLSYFATDYEFSWSSYAQLQNKIALASSPPFKTEKQNRGMDPNKIRIWIRTTDEIKLKSAGSFSDDIQGYYYGATGHFMPIQYWGKILLQLSNSPDTPDPGTPAAVTKGNTQPKSSGKSKFTTFNGDKDNIPMDTLADGQIEEMVGYGTPRQAAISTIIDINERAQYNHRALQTQNEFDSSTFIQNFADVDEFGQAKNIISKDGLPAIKQGGFTPGDISIQVRFSNSGQAYGGAQAAPDLPIMIQTYPYYDKNTDSFEFVADKFYFHYKPNNVTYSNIGAEWQDIGRVNNTPIIDFKNFKLMKITFEFIVAEKLDGVSSLYASCESQLKMLRQMAIRPEYVQFTNLDTLFSEQLSYPDFLSSGEATYFAIVDMSVTSVQRARAGIDNVAFGSPAGSINRATVNMTVQEVNNSGPAPIFMPRITQPPKTPPPRTPNSDELCKARFTWISPSRWVHKAEPHSCD